MSHRSRLLLALILMVLVPLVVLAVGVRNEMRRRLSAEYEERLDSLVSVIAEDLELQGASIDGRLGAVGGALERDNRFRLAAVAGRESERGYLLDYAATAMSVSGLSMLQIQDVQGTILSSGHFRNEYGRLESGLPEALSSAPGGTALIWARTAEGPMLTLARSHSFTLADRRFWVVGGIAVRREMLARLAREGGLAVSLLVPDGAMSSDPELGAALPSSGPEAFVRSLPVPFVETESEIPRVRAATILVTHPLTSLRELRRSIDRWFLGVTAITGLAALGLAIWLSSHISRPLSELAGKTEQVELDRLDVDFTSRRRDEIGTLSRLLGAMTERLDAGRASLKAAERRAALGDLARQVNHDIKNGLLPIRNVLRHLFQVAEDQPRQLPSVLRERRSTLESGIAYLETLAANYARLSPRLQALSNDVNRVVEQVARDAGHRDHVQVEMRLAEDLPTVLGDPVALRRIVENLVFNAVESLDSQGGRVILATESLAGDGGEAQVCITVTDTGGGLKPGETEKIFDDFYTTKEGGTGLGLSIVRRLVMDFAGSIDVESVPSGGTRFIVSLPAGGTPERDSTEASNQGGRP